MRTREATPRLGLPVQMLGDLTSGSASEDFVYSQLFEAFVAGIFSRPSNFDYYGL